VISNTALHAIDGDSPPSDLLYKLQSLPQAGVLVVTSPGTRPYELRLDESFSEEQISRNQVHYRHNIEQGYTLFYSLDTISGLYEKQAQRQVFEPKFVEKQILDRKT
jgi:hypothetical protein